MKETLEDYSKKVGTNLLGMVPSCINGAFTGFCAFKSLTHILDYVNTKAVILQSRLSELSGEGSYSSLKLIEDFAEGDLAYGIVYGIAAGGFLGLTLFTSKRDNSMMPEF